MKRTDGPSFLEVRCEYVTVWTQQYLNLMTRHPRRENGRRIDNFVRNGDLIVNMNLPLFLISDLEIIDLKLVLNILI